MSTSAFFSWSKPPLSSISLLRYVSVSWNISAHAYTSMLIIRDVWKMHGYYCIDNDYKHQLCFFCHEEHGTSCATMRQQQDRIYILNAIIAILSVKFDISFDEMRKRYLLWRNVLLQFAVTVMHVIVIRRQEYGKTNDAVGVWKLLIAIRYTSS
jgi:hypothetical protein